MMKSEFEDRIGHSISEEEYSTIEYVYTWYPTISETEGKAQIAKLYTDFGIPLIEDMVERAGQMEKLETELGVARNQVTIVQNRIKQLRGEKNV